MWLQRYGDNALLVCVAVAGLAFNLRYIRHCPPGIPRALKGVAAVALGYVVVVQSCYVVGMHLSNGWYEAAALVLAAVLALNAWVGRNRGPCD